MFRGNGEEDASNYRQTWKDQLRHVQRAMAGGVNQIVFHGYAYSGQYEGEGNENGYVAGTFWAGLEFNAMSEKMRGLLDDITREKLKNKNAEIKALQSEYDSLQAKINPHFLYNTLESINSMAKISGEEEIARAIQLLGNYLQDTVSRENRFVTLGEELQNALDYIQIQQIVHGGRLDYETDVDEVLLEAVVPKLILQPLIENAVVHGLEPKQGWGKIRIRIFCQGQDLLIQIADDGVGITSSKLKDGMIVASGKSTHHSHVGIQTVHKRIQILYGKNYGITVESKEKEGTTICIALPIQFEGEEDVQDYFGG